MRKAAILALMLAAPRLALAQDAPTVRDATPADREAAETLPADSDSESADVSGAPLVLGIVPLEAPLPVRPAPADGRIVEHELYVAARGTAQPTFSDETLELLPTPLWPGAHLQAGWDLTPTLTAPPLYPSVSAALLTQLGGSDGVTGFSQRVKLDLYLLQLGFDAVTSLDGARSRASSVEADLRIPIPLAEGHRLAFVPGVTFPVDEREAVEATTNIRAQLMYGLFGGGLGAQLRAGFTEGTRTPGLLPFHAATAVPAVTLGVLGSARLLPIFELRLEAATELATAGGPELFTLAPGLTFYPWADPRLALGFVGVLEQQAPELALDDPALGGLFVLGIRFI